MQLKIENLTRNFNGQKALDNLSISLTNVTSLVLIGPSGSGKTTLLRVLAGLETPDAGTIRINQRPLLFDEASLHSHRKRIGVVFQGYNLFPHLSAEENIVLPLTKVHGLTREEAMARAHTLLSRFALTGHKDKKPAQLSGGQQQRIALCRTAALKPEVMLLDEPTSALDPEFTTEVLDLVHGLQKEGIELIMVTHEMGFAASAADHVIFMDQGRILANGRPEEIFKNNPNTRINAFISKVLKY